MRRTLRVLAWSTATLCAIAALALVAVVSLANTDWAREKARTTLTSQLNRIAHGTVRIGGVSGNLLRGATLHDVSITDSTGAPFVTVDTVSARYDWRAVLARQLDLMDVHLVRPVVVLERMPGGIWNYQRIFPASASTGRAISNGLQLGDWVVLHNTRVHDGLVTIRVPWQPAPYLTGSALERATRAALDTSSRIVVTRVAGGFERTEVLRSINAQVPLARITMPGTHSRFITVDSVSTTALIFAPPATDVRQARGHVEFDHDSAWFDVKELALPSSHASVSGRYNMNSGDLALRTIARPAALADLHFLYPLLPDEGQATFDLAFLSTSVEQQYVMRALALTTGTATVSGEVGVTSGETVVLNHTSLVFAGVDTRLVERVAPALNLKQRGVLSGRARLDGGREAMHVDGDVTFLDRRTGVNRMIAAGEVGSTNGVVRARGLHVTVSPLQVDLAFASLKDMPVHGTLTGSAILDGSTATQLATRQLDLTHIDRGERSHLSGSGAVRLGDAPWFALDVVADSLSLVSAGRFAPSAQLRGNTAGPIHVSGTARDLTVNAALTTSDGGRMNIAGSLDVSGNEPDYQLRAIATAFNTNLVSPSAPRTLLNAQLDARGRGLALGTMQSAFTATLANSTVDTVAVDSSRAGIRVANGVATVDSFGVWLPGASSRVAGTFGVTPSTSGTLTFSARIDTAGRLARYLPLDTATVLPRPGILADRFRAARADSSRIAENLAVARAAGVAPPAVPVAVPVPRSIRRDTLGGTAFTSGTMVGGIQKFDIEGSANVTGLMLLGNSVQRAHATYRWNDVRTPKARMDVTASGDSISAYGFALDSVRAQWSSASPSATASVRVYENARRDYAAHATLAMSGDQRDVRLDSLRLRFDTTRWVATRAATVHWGPQGVVIDSVDVRNGHGGQVFVNGRLPTEGEAQLELKVAAFDIGDLMGLLQSDYQARGLVSFDARMEGGTIAPVIAGSAQVTNATYGGVVVPDVHATFRYANQRLVAAADATVSGRAVAAATATVPVNFAMTGVTGSRLLDGASSIDVKADSLPLDMMSRFTEAVSEVRGVVVGTVALRGPIRKPDVTGSLALARGEMRLTTLGVKLLAVNGAVHVAGERLVIDSMTAVSAGTIGITGSLGIADPRAPSFDVRITADNARVLDNDKGRARADAHISVTGPFDAVAVNGTARIRQGVMYIPKPDSREMISAGDAVVFAVVDTSDRRLRDVLPGSSTLLANVAMNLRLSVDRDTWVRSSEANVEIFSDGDLQIKVDQKRGTLTLTGVVNSDRGEYEFLSRRFRIKRGSATFVGGAEMNPLLQLTGEYELKQTSAQAIKIRVQIGGTLLAPRLTLDSDAQPPISQSDLLSYLAFGAESGSLLQFGGSSVSGGTVGGGLVGTTAALATRQLAGVALGVAVNQLEGRAARSLGADVFNISPANIQPELAGGNFNGLSTFLKGTQLEYGKYFTTRTFVGLQVQATAALGFRVEHRFSGQDGLSLESTLQPRYFLPEPSLAPQGLKTANAFGVFLVRRWRF